MLSFKPIFSLSSFTFIKRLLSSSLLSAIRVVSSVYLRLLIFLLVILIPACASSSWAFHMMYSAYKLNKQSDNIQPWCTPFSILNQSIVPCPVLTVASWPAYRFLRRQVRWADISISWRILYSLLWSKIISLLQLTVQFITQLCLTLCDIMDNSMLGFRCPSPTPGACSNSCLLSQWCHQAISSSVIPFSSCLQSFPASESFLMSQFFASGGQSIGVSASALVLPMNIQSWIFLISFRIDWFDLLEVQGILKNHSFAF